MAWRVLNGGPMLEIVGVGVKGAAPFEQIVTAQEGMIIEDPRDLSPSMRKRYESGEEFLRAVVEYGEVEETEGDDGETVKVFVPKGVEAAVETSPATPDVLARAEDAEGKVTELSSRVTELEQSLEAEKRRADVAEKALDGALSYGELSKDALELEAGAQKIDVKRADGKAGEPTKSDYAAALEEARKAS